MKPQCPLAGEWINKMWYAYNKIFSLKHEGNSKTFYNIPEMEDIMLGKISQIL